MTDSIDTSDREAEEPRGPIRLPVREMRDEPVPHQAADPLRSALQLALEATPEELPAALNTLRAALSNPPVAQEQRGDAERVARHCHVFNVTKTGALTEWEPTTMAFALPDGKHALYTTPPAQASDAMDAARYQWLRDADPDNGPFIARSQVDSWGNPRTDILQGTDADAAIDAARKGEQQP